MRTLALSLMVLLGACNASGEEANGVAPDLETAAVARGLVRDPSDATPVGLFARETDRLCVVEARGGYAVGATTDFGDGISCSASGVAQRSGGRLTIEFGQDCKVEATFRDDHIVFPARLPGGCARFCRGRASFAAVDVARLSDSASEARAMRGANGKLLCAAD